MFYKINGNTRDKNLWLYKFAWKFVRRYSVFAKMKLFVLALFVAVASAAPPASGKYL